MVTDDNGPVIVGVSWFLCWFSGAFLALRLYAKVSRKQGLWWDDHILLFSWIMLLIGSIITQVGQQLGFGMRNADIPIENLATIALGSSVAASISCFASTFSKISFGVTLLRLTCGPVRAFVWFCIITLFIVMLPSAFLAWISCRPMARAWNSTLEGECWDPRVTIGYGIFNAAWCVAADFALALLPWKVVWGLRLNMKEKMGVVIAMSMGLLAGVCAVIKGAYLVQLRQDDFFYNGKDLTIWTAVETATAIVGASIPVLRVFFKATMSSLSSRTGHTSRTNPFSKSSSVPMSRIPQTVDARRPRAVTGDSASEWSILREPEDEMVVEEGWQKGQGHGGILQTSTITVRYEEERSDEFGGDGRERRGEGARP